MPTEVFLRKMSDHMESGIVVGWLVDEGDEVQKGQPLLEFETDKANVELPSPASGVIRGIRPGIDPGVKVPVGETIAFVTEPDEEPPSLPPFVPENGVGADENGGSNEESKEARRVDEDTRVQATPVVRKLARDLGVELELVEGTGSKGRVTKRDVRDYVEKTRPESLASQDSGTDGEWLELTQGQKLTGERMLESVRSVPQFSLTMNADSTNLLDLQKSISQSLPEGSHSPPSITSILVSLVSNALAKFPRANASYRDGRVRLHRRINIGVAIGLETGLVVPVVKDANKKTIPEISEELSRYQEKAKSGGLEIEDLSGGTFTISNLGMYGVDQFTAIVNPPESAILAVGQIVHSPSRVSGEAIALRPTMSLTLSVDHRSMDGVQGARLMQTIKELVEEAHPPMRESLQAEDN